LPRQARLDAPGRTRRIRTFTLLNRVPFGKFNRVNFRYTTSTFLVASGDYPTSLRQDRYMPCFSQTRRSLSEDGLRSVPHGSALLTRRSLWRRGLPLASTFVNMLNILTGFILIRFLHKSLGADFSRVAHKQYYK
jgi:hypothetical protein